MYRMINIEYFSTATALGVFLEVFAKLAFETSKVEASWRTFLEAKIGYSSSITNYCFCLVDAINYGQRFASLRNIWKGFTNMPNILNLWSRTDFFIGFLGNKSYPEALCFNKATSAFSSPGFGIRRLMNDKAIFQLFKDTCDRGLWYVKDWKDVLS